MVKIVLRIVQISDMHLFENTDETLLGVNTQQSFRVLLDLLKADEMAPDLILLTGDLSQDGTEKSYQRLAEQVSELQIPVYCVAGNHDLTDAMRQIYPYAMISMDKHIIAENWQLILLDSNVVGKVHGYLDERQLTFMEQCLKTHPKQRAIIVFHHQPVPVYCDWLDKLGVLNAEEFWQVAAKYPQIHTILFGHVHQQYEGNKNGIALYSTPSTCIQFKRKSAEFALEKIPPAYRIIELYANGELRTQVRYAKDYVGIFEKDAKGY